MMYMPADSATTASAVSYAVYHLSQCPSTSENITDYAFPWREDTNGHWWMEWPSSMILPVHPERGPELAAVLAGFVGAGHLAQASADAILALAASREGSTVTLAEVTPPEWAAVMQNDTAISFPQAPI